MTKPIYLISGLGADERIFQNLDFGQYQPKHIKWIEPEKEENLKDYALRLSEQIITANPTILGVSFGGMIAIEVAKQIECQQVIIVSSAKTKYEIPSIYRFFGQLKLHKLVPITMLKQANFLTYWFFGMTIKAEKQLLKNILRDTDKAFLKWAIDAILKWENTEGMTNVVHLHGNSDRILPLKNIKQVDFVIENGGHLMIYNQAKTITEVL